MLLIRTIIPKREEENLQAAQKNQFTTADKIASAWQFSQNCKETCVENEVKYCMEFTGNHASFIVQTNRNPGRRFFKDLVAGTGQYPDPRIFIPNNALPKNYRYRHRQEEKTKPEGRGLRTVAFHAHPSDVSGDFLPYIFLLEKDREGAAFQPVILSLGEASKAAKRPFFENKDIVQVRIDEEKAACDELSMPHPRYLQSVDGNNFPDGKMMEHLPAIRDSIKAYIRKHQPERIVLPSSYPDHADHLAVYIAGMNAVLDLQKEGYFQQHGLVEILSCEPEFGITQGRKLTLDKIPVAFGGHKEMPQEKLDGMIYPRYQFQLDADTGKVTPAQDITQHGEDKKAHSLNKHTIAAAPFIVKIPNEMAELKMKAMAAHQTQMIGTSYGRKIMALDHLRGLETGAEWGVGIYPVKIPGVTRKDSPFLDNLDPATVFQLEKTRQIVKTPAAHRR